MDDLISRQAAINSSVKMIAQGLDWVPVFHLEQLPSAERSLWFRIGEVCVDESKGFISAGRAVEKIRELLRGAERGWGE